MKRKLLFYFVLALLLCCFIGVVFGTLISGFFGILQGKGHEKTDDGEGGLIGWQSPTSAGFFRSKKDINSLQFSKSTSNVHFFSVDENSGVTDSFSERTSPSHEHFRVEVRVGEITSDEVRKTIQEAIDSHTDTNDPPNRRSTESPSTTSSSYECQGSCWCDKSTIDPSRRSITTSAIRNGYFYISAAVTATVALKMAEEYFRDDCESTLSELENCPSNSIHSQVETCELYNERSDDMFLEPEYEDMVNSVMAFVGTHDKLEYQIHAISESQAIDMGVKNAVEETKPYIASIEGGIAGIVIAFAVWKMYKGHTYAFREPFDHDKDRAICCAKCKGIIGFRFGVCCEMPLSDKKVFEDVEYVNDLMYYSYPTLDEMCRIANRNDGLGNLNANMATKVTKSFVKETSIKCTINNAVIRDRIYVDNLQKCNVKKIYRKPRGYEEIEE